MQSAWARRFARKISRGSRSLLGDLYDGGPDAAPVIRRVRHRMRYGGEHHQAIQITADTSTSPLYWSPETLYLSL